jgi:class 3 adenylate cyclase/tetratricopeptide (TPR) repeat protein
MSSRGVETVTILITDLVGSTELESRVGPIIAEELRQEHFGLLRDAVGDAGGREVKNTGDGLMVAFESAAAAVSCAVSVQQRFQRRNRSAVESLPIKAGLSSGDASTAEGEVFGLPVIEAARLCDRCSAGQILAKEIVADLAAGRGHAFKPVGALELKGLPEPLSAVEVQWDPAPASAIKLPERLRELPATAYVGRVAERARLTELWAQARERSLRLVLIGGEAGVGKTRLATHLAIDAHKDGATVLYGRSDEDLGVPYQPWVQALGYLVKEAPRRILDAHVERYGGDLARLVPVLRDRIPELPSPRESDPETERYLLYAAVAGLLESAGEQEPLLLILDDLHWADQPTLSLLRHVVIAGSSMRVMMVGAYRDSELSQDHPLARLLADLHREQGVERLTLSGLDAEDVRALMEALAGQELDEDGHALAREIARETAGNPFFAVELLRHLRESGAIAQRDDGRWRLVGDLAELGLPQSVREVIGRRVARLGSDARTALSAAAVIGRDFEVDLLLAMLDLPEARLLDLLAEAVGASLLQENRDRAGRFTFTHALVEHTLYEDLGATRRAVLHRQIAEALEELCGDQPGERLGELAGHWGAAVVRADTAKALRYAKLAAERALEQLAPDEAARWYRHALELHAEGPGEDRPGRCDLLIGLGEAQFQSGNPEHRQTLLDAAELAQQLGDSGRLCRAVLANIRGWTSQNGTVDSERVRAIERTAVALPNDDSRRAIVLALLACEIHYGGDPARCRALVTEAIEIARSAGDPSALAHTLYNAIYAIWVPDALPERKRLSDELVELAQRLNDPRLSFWAAQRRWDVLTDAGDGSRAESTLEAIRTLAAASSQPTFAWLRLQYESVWALIEGNLPAAEQCAIQAFEAGTASGQIDALTLFGAQLSNLRYHQGRIGELVEQIVEFAADPDNFDGWRALAAIALIESGRQDEAREMALAEDFHRLPWDAVWLAAGFSWADACCRLRLVERAGELYDLLAPFPGQLAAGGGVTVFGAIDQALGALATTLERYEQAEGHFAAAMKIVERFGAPLLLARTQAGWARALIDRGRPEDLERAETMLDEAEKTAERLGGGLVAREVAECRGALAATSR